PPWCNPAAALPRHVGIDDLRERKPAWLLQAARERAGASMARARRAAERIALSAVETHRLAEAGFHAVDYELGRERGEDHAKHARDHRLELGPKHPHDRPGRQQ